VSLPTVERSVERTTRNSPLRTTGFVKGVAGTGRKSPCAKQEKAANKGDRKCLEAAHIHFTARLFFFCFVSSKAAAMGGRYFFGVFGSGNSSAAIAAIFFDVAIMLSNHALCSGNFPAHHGPVRLRQNSGGAWDAPIAFSSCHPF
jgi:hypothetical protein